MNKLAIVCCVFFISITGSAGAMPPMGEACGSPDIDRLQQQLDLTEEQAVALRTILDERFQSRVLLHKRHHDEMEQHHAETYSRLSAVLNESQIELLEAHRLWHEKMRQPGGGR